MEIKQQLKLSQSLVMTPQLQQAIRLLQLSRVELIDEVRQELDANPVLADEDIDPRQRVVEDTSLPSEKPGASPLEERVGETERVELDTNMQRREEQRQANEVDWEQFLENRSLQRPVPSGGGGGNSDLPGPEATLTKAPSLADHLLRQVQFSDFIEEERDFAELVIGNLDENGYLNLTGVKNEGEQAGTPDQTVDDLAKMAGLQTEDAEEVLKLIQQMDPVGVAARDLRESLLVQAEFYGLGELEVAIIRDYMDALERHAYHQIVKGLRVSMEEVGVAVGRIQELDNRPSRNFSETDDKTIGITPDVYVIKDGDEFVVLDNDQGLQRLYVNEALTRRLLRANSIPQLILFVKTAAGWHRAELVGVHDPQEVRGFLAREIAAAKAKHVAAKTKPSGNVGQQTSRK